MICILICLEEKYDLFVGSFWYAMWNGCVNAGMVSIEKSYGMGNLILFFFSFPIDM